MEDQHKRNLRRAAGALACMLLAACGTKVDADQGGDGPDGLPAADAAIRIERCGSVTAVLRDFRADHPDMQRAIASIRGLVKNELGVDGRPVYRPDGPTEVTESAESFDQWYRDIDGVNMRFEQELVLGDVGGGVYVFEDNNFFPLDGLGFGGEQINGHNYHFTTEIRGTFRYRGGEKFTFTGDDDVFVFVNERLALDLGGVHSVEAASIDFDAVAAELGIEAGGLYDLDIFHAERHTTESNFRIETSIDCLNVID